MDPTTTLPTGAPEPGTLLEVTIERAAALGRGVARVEGLTVLVARGVPGEAATVAVERAYPRHVLARVVTVQRPSAGRREPPCDHFEHCGGCDWQHLDDPEQRAIKRAVLTEQLERIGGLAAPGAWALVPPRSPLAYRDRLEFTPLAVGSRYAPAFHDLDGRARVAIAHCRLAPQRYTELAQAVLDALVQSGALPAPQPGTALPLQRLTVQATERPEGGAGLAVLLHLRAAGGQSEGNLRRSWQQAAQAVREPLQAAFPELVALALQFPARMGRGGPRRSGPTVAVAWGPSRLIKRVHGRAYRVPHAAFFQVNPEMAGALLAHVLEQAQSTLGGVKAAPGRPVYDLFGGVGLFALPLAERGHTVVGVDNDREGLRAASETARGLDLSTCSFRRADLERAGALERLLAEHGPPALVLCDPPRRGLSQALCGALLAAAPPAIVYVSCDGGTFARDAARLAPAYRLAELRGFDLFPQTHHLELVGTFVRA